ncbi:hypothetical protein IF188_13750 [Microbacterium sp. NEAU-LLC]|uniref:Glycosyl transferase n=1 Tax=Microbacterium helvum TaxID=2773713 RepID=A0ABR8NQ39_9MICO|nr:hypothetical protein [Microbacterium helvum]MBD3942760.1 hypothetical protein [Microbacterium helvum]
MGYLVLITGLIQAAVGVALLMSWARHARGQDAGLIVTHVVAMLGFFVPWTLFIATREPLWAWVGFVVLVAFIGFGDTEVVRRTSRDRGVARPRLPDYWRSMVAVCAGRYGRALQFHTLFSAAVFFPALYVAIAATVGG